MRVDLIPIRFEYLGEIQLQLLFEERMFEGFEKTAIKYCRWLLTLDEAQRENHHRSLSRIAHVVRTARGRLVDIAPESNCPMCTQWRSAATQELCKEAEYEQIRREGEKKAPRLPKPTFIYLALDERTGYIKIGRAKNPSARERTLQSENPQFRMLFSGPADAYLEHELHIEHAKCRVRGEWFKLTDQQTESIKKRILDSAKNESKAIPRV